MAESIYETLSKHVDTIPAEGEDEQTYLVRLFRTVNKLPEEEFYKLPEEAQNWCNDAAEAIEFTKPVQMCPGAPFANGSDTDKEEAASPPRKAAAKPAGGKKAAAKATGEGRKAPPKEKAAAKPPKEKAPPKERVGRQPGVLDHLMDAMHADPKATPAQLKERVEDKHKIEVKEANAIGIRQQYRRFVRFMQNKGLLKDIKLD